MSITRPPIEGAVYIPLALLAPSPTNPRKSFDQAHLEELAGSLKKHGQISPIVARPHPAGTPEWLAEAGRPLYEIVAGERRWRAANLAEMPSIMTIVREMTDFEVLEVQVIENLQREDLDPLDEAAGYHALLRGGDKVQGYASVDELASRIGKSRRYVYNRLKLMDLCPEGRQALANGDMPVSVAQLIAGLPDAKAQAEATARVLQGFGGEPLTYRAALQHITNTYMLRLDRATFDTAAVYTVAGPCGSCPKRSGAHGDLFADAGTADHCQDATCYHAKADEAHQIEIDMARSSGYELIQGDKARAILPSPSGEPISGHRRLDKPCPALTESKHTLHALLGPRFRPVLALDHPVSETVILVAPEMAVRKALHAKQLLRAGLATSEEDFAGGSKSRGSDDDTGDNEGADQAQGQQHAPQRQTTSPLRPMTPAQMETARHRRRAELFGSRAFTALHEALVARDELPVAALELMLVNRFDDLSHEACGLIYHARGWPQVPHYHDWLADFRKRIEGLSGRQLGELLIEASLLAEDLSDRIPLEEMHYSAAPELAEAMDVDLKSIDAEAAQLAQEQIDAEQAELERAQAQAKRDKMLPPSAGEVTGVHKAAKTSLKATVKYRNAQTGETWSGRGLQPRWLKAALAAGRSIHEFAASAQADAATEAFAGTTEAAA